MTIASSILPEQTAWIPGRRRFHPIRASPIASAKRSVWVVPGSCRMTGTFCVGAMLYRGTHSSSGFPLHQEPVLLQVGYAITLFFRPAVNSASAWSQSSKSCPCSFPRCSKSLYARSLIACFSSGLISFCVGVLVVEGGFRRAFMACSSILHASRA